MNPLTDPPPPRRKRRNPLAKLVEFRGIRRLALPKYRNKVKKMYDGPAGAVLAIGSFLSLHEPLIGNLLKHKKFDVSNFNRILDVGSGAGQILKHLIKTVSPETQLVAFDLSQQMLKRARIRIKDRRPCYIAGDMMQMPFAEDAFDCVTCGWVIEHLPDPVPGLEEVRRVLKPGGSALILATEDTVPGAMTSRTWKCRTYNRDELRQACDTSGLPWKEQLWFTKVHQFFKMGGILVEATKPLESKPTSDRLNGEPTMVE